uniref:Uncharacterized protein n=1 Tax=Arundo donax TaxID=35708 RepID=A0A0A9E024_ARUDO
MHLHRELMSRLGLCHPLDPLVTQELQVIPLEMFLTH